MRAVGTNSRVTKETRFHLFIDIITSRLFSIFVGILYLLSFFHPSTVCIFYFFYSCR